MSGKFECELPRHESAPEDIREVLEKYKVVAVVGLSTNPAKASFQVAAYLKAAGYTIIPIHPKADEIMGEKAYPDLISVPASAGIEIVDIFRRPDAVGPHVDEAIAVGAKVVWFQEGIVNNEAAAKAEAAGLKAIQNRCMLKEHGRL